MGTIIDEFMVKMKLDGKEWAQDAKEVEQSIKGVKEELKNTESAGKSFGGMAEGLKGKLMGLVGAFTALYGVQQTFSSYLSEADQLGKFSNMLDLNIEDVHAWGKAVELSGGSMQGFQGSLEALQTQLAKISTTGNSRIKPVLESMHIDPGEEGRMRNAFDVMGEIQERFAEMSKTESLGKGKLLQFDTGTIMFMQQTREATGDIIQKIKELGVYTKEDAQITADFNDAITLTKLGFVSFASIIFRMVTPALQGIVDGFTSFVSYLRRHEVAVQSFFIMLATLITARLIPAFLTLAKTVAKNPFTWVIAGIALLSLAIEDLYVWANGGDAVFGEFWEAVFGSKDEALQFFKDLTETVIVLTKAITDAVKAWKELTTDDSVFKNLKDIKSRWENFSLDQYLTDVQNRSNSGMGFFDSLYGSQEEIDKANSRLETYFGFLKNKAQEEGQQSGQAYNDGLQTAMNGEALDNEGNKVDWLDRQFIALAETVHGTVPKGTEEFNKQTASINASGKAIDLFSSKLDALRLNIMTMPTYNPSMAFAGGATYNSANTRIGAINVNTQATDASGIGSSIGPAMSSGFNPFKSNGGAF